MIPLFDKDTELQAWIGKDGNVFNLEMEWIAFIEHGHVFSAESIEWLGPVDGFTFLDQSGRPFLWSPKSKIRGQLPSLRPLKPLRPLQPLQPLRPLDPLRPLQPLTPLGGWSNLTERKLLFWGCRGLREGVKQQTVDALQGAGI
jgi:hypothetical protein